MDKVTIKIPRNLYDKIRDVIDQSGFNSPTDFVVYVLRDLMSERAEKRPDEEFTKSEIDAVRRKLKSLGYL
jgi:metal-responsive CopG/Arc/MetJ family transcriptional regulator